MYKIESDKQSLKVTSSENRIRCKKKIANPEEHFEDQNLTNRD